MIELGPEQQDAANAARIEFLDYMAVRAENEDTGQKNAQSQLNVAYTMLGFFGGRCQEPYLDLAHRALSRRTNILARLQMLAGGNPTVNLQDAQATYAPPFTASELLQVVD